MVKQAAVLQIITPNFSFGKSIDTNSKLPSGTWKEKKGEINDTDKKKMHELYLIHNKNQTVKKRTAVKISKEVAAKKGNPYDSTSRFFNG